MQIINRVISLSNLDKSDLEQICFNCPGALKDDLKVIAKHYGVTVTSLIINSCTALVEDFKGGADSTLNIHQSRACIKIDDLEEQLEPFLANDVHINNPEIAFGHRGYIFDYEKSGGYENKIDNIINRIENLKKLIGEE
jgi:hypothetical protein